MVEFALKTNTNKAFNGAKLIQKVTRNNFGAKTFYAQPIVQFLQRVMNFATLIGASVWHLSSVRWATG